MLAPKSLIVRAFLPVLALLAASAPALAQTLWVVDDGGGGDFLQIQQAVNAAADGDTILVENGSYASFVVDDQELTIVAEGSAVLTGTVRLRNLSAGKTLVLEGLTARGADNCSPSVGCGLFAVDCAGPVRIADCIFEQGNCPNWSAVAGGLVENCSDLSLSDCSLLGHDGDLSGGWPGDGLRSNNSEIALFGSYCAGGTAASFGLGGPCAKDGAPGASVWGSGEFFAAECVFLGGDAGYDWCHNPVGNDGGHGLQSWQQAQCRILDCVAVGGQYGCSEGLPPICGMDGLPTSGNVVGLPGSASVVDGPSIVVSGPTVEFDFSGPVGSRVFLLAGTAAAYEYTARWKGVLLLAHPLLDFAGPAAGGAHHLPSIPLGFSGPYLGDIPAGGHLQVIVAREALPGGTDAETFFLQGLLRNAQGQGTLTGPLTLTLIEPDCNGNGISDYLDLSAGTSADCNGNAIPDECDIQSGTSTDLNGDGIPDECHSQARLYVDAGASPGGSGLSWPAAFDDLQAALEFARAIPGGVESIWVAEGVYRPAAPGSPANSTFQLDPGMRLFGGFAGDETSLSERDPALHPTVLSGDINGDDPTGGFSDNSEHVVSLGTGGEPRRLDGFVVSGGYAVFMTYYGAGGGVDAVGAHGWTIANCVIEGNHAVEAGGGLRALQASGEIVNTIFRGNTSEEGGGLAGVHCDGMRLVNCLFTGNEAELGGGLSVLDSEDVILTACTIANNTATVGSGGGAWLEPAAPSLRLASCIAWGNTAAQGSLEEQQLHAAAAGAEATFCCIEGFNVFPGADNHGLDPRFVSALGPDGIAGTADDDLRLGAGSPCVDSSRNQLLPLDTADLDHDGDTTERLPLDLAGNARRIDDPAVPDTGLGVAPILDQGALERVPRGRR